MSDIVKRLRNPIRIKTDYGLELDRREAADRIEQLEALLAEAERKLQLIAAHTGHNKFLADRELLSDLLIRIQRICNDKPADSAPAFHDCGKPLKLGQYGECVWCGYMPDKNYPSDQPSSASGEGEK